MNLDSQADFVSKIELFLTNCLLRRCSCGMSEQLEAPPLGRSEGLSALVRIVK